MKKEKNILEGIQNGDESYGDPRLKIYIIKYFIAKQSKNWKKNICSNVFYLKKCLFWKGRFVVNLTVW